MKGYSTPHHSIFSPPLLGKLKSLAKCNASAYGVQVTLAKCVVSLLAPLPTFLSEKKSQMGQPASQRLTRKFVDRIAIRKNLPQ